MSRPSLRILDPGSAPTLTEIREALRERWQALGVTERPPTLDDLLGAEERIQLARLGLVPIPATWVESIVRGTRGPTPRCSQCGRGL